MINNFKKQIYKKPGVALFLAYAIWGINTPMTKLGAEEIPIYSFGFFKFIIATFLVFLIFGQLNLKHILRKDTILLAIKILLNIAHLALFYIGIRYITGVNASILWSLGPIFLYVGSIEFLHERFKWRTLFGLVIAIVGAILVVVSSAQSGSTSEVLLGNGLVILAVITDTATNLISKRLLKSISSHEIIKATLLGIMILFGVLSLSELGTWQSITNISNGAWFSVFYGGIMSAVVAYVLFYEGLRKIDAEDASVFGYIDPIFAIVVSMLIFNELPGMTFWVGAIAILLGVYITETKYHLKFKYAHYLRYGRH